MSILNNVLKSYKYFLQNIPLINAYIYYDANIDISKTYVCRSKVDLPLGTETTFIIQVQNGATWVDGVNANDTTFLLYKYILFKNSSDITTYIPITAYNNITGQITIGSNFGEAIETTDTFEVVVLNSIFINAETMDDLGNSSRFNETATRFYMDIKTKNDGDKENILDIIEKIRSNIGKYQNLPLYDSTLTTIQAYAKFEDNGRYNNTLDKGEQIVEYLGTTRVHYYINNFG